MKFSFNIQNFNLAQVLFDSKIIKGSNESWSIVLEITLWHIWKARNELIFQGSILNINTVILFIKRESFSMCLNGNMISLKEASLWFIYPAAVMHSWLTRMKSIFLANLFSDHRVVAFGDGSWNLQDIEAGIRGLIIFKYFSLRYVFSGPIKVSNPFDTQLAACMHI